MLAGCRCSITNQSLRAATPLRRSCLPRSPSEYGRSSTQRAIISPRGETINIGETMTRTSPGAAIDWIVRLAERTGSFKVGKQTEAPRRGHSDWRLSLRPSGGGRPIQADIQIRQRMAPQEVYGIAAYRQQLPPHATLIVCCPVISNRVAEICREHRIGFLDAAGNCHIEAPGLFLHVEGRANSAREVRKAVDLFALKSSRITRVLLGDIHRGWQIQELRRETGVSIGLVSRIKHRLLEEAFVELRDGLVVVRDPHGLLAAWRNAYEIPERVPLYTMEDAARTATRISEWSQANGLPSALAAFSGAWRLAPMVRQSNLHAYVKLPSNSQWEELLAAIHAKRVDSGANLTIWLPRDDYVFYRAQAIEGISVVSALQLYLDLSMIPGRGAEAAREILDQEIVPSWKLAANTTTMPSPPASPS